MNINDAGLDLIREYESCRLEAYPDPGTGGDPWTVGWGDTQNVQEGLVITQAEADARLAARLNEFSVWVRSLVKGDLTDNQFSAVVSLAYNLRRHTFLDSTLLRRINEGDLEGAAFEFPKFNRANGQVLNGLIARRAAEQALFLQA